LSLARRKSPELDVGSCVTSLVASGTLDAALAATTGDVQGPPGSAGRSLKEADAVWIAHASVVRLMASDRPA
jgi:hypothetical protein